MAFLLRFYPQLWPTGVTGWLILLPWSNASFLTISRFPFSYPLPLFYFRSWGRNENLIWVPGSLEYKWSFLHLVHLKFTFKCQMTSLPTGFPPTPRKLSHTGGSLEASGLLWLGFISCTLLAELFLFCCYVLSDWDPTNCSTPGFPVLHCLPEFAQTHVLWVGDAIQPSHPLSPPSPLALNLSHHQGLFQQFHQVANVSS